MGTGAGSGGRTGAGPGSLGQGSEPRTTSAKDRSGETGQEPGKSAEAADTATVTTGARTGGGSRGELGCGWGAVPIADSALAASAAENIA
ncbi:hypothetical protein EV177_007488, partial [Coemansia sp. RSA 1804]